MWLGRVGIELDNFRAAFDRAVATGDQDTALSISGSLWRYWQIKGLLAEARDRLETALAMTSDGTPALRARALTGLGGIIYWQGRWDEITEPYREALEVHLALGDRAGIAEALYNLSFPRGYAGDYEEMERLLRESLELSEEIGWQIGIGRAYWALANMASYSEDWDSSIDFARKAADVFIEEDAPFDLGWAWFMVAHGYARSGRGEEARDTILSALEIFTRVRDVSALTLIFETISYVVLLLGDGETAAYFARLPPESRPTLVSRSETSR